MEKERKIEAPEGCEIEKVEIVDGASVVSFRNFRPLIEKLKPLYGIKKGGKE